MTVWLLAADRVTVNSALTVPELPSTTVTSLIETLGGGALSLLSGARAFFELAADTLYWAFVAPFKGRAYRLKTDLLAAYHGNASNRPYSPDHASAARRPLSGKLSQASVITLPGDTMLTRMPCGASSLAMPRVSASMADFEAA